MGRDLGDNPPAQYEQFWTLKIWKLSLMADYLKWWWIRMSLMQTCTACGTSSQQVASISFSLPRAWQQPITSSSGSQQKSGDLWKARLSVNQRLAGCIQLGRSQVMCARTIVKLSEAGEQEYWSTKSQVLLWCIRNKKIHKSFESSVRGFNIWL